MPPALARDSSLAQGRRCRRPGSPGPVNAQRSERFLVKQSVRTSPTFGICIWFSFPRFSLFFFSFCSCFGPSERATHGTNWTTRPPDPPPECVPNTLCAGPLTQFPVVPVPAGSTLQLQLEALFHYEHAHSGTRKYAHTSPYLFICEWTNTRQNAFGIFNVIYLSLF